MGAGILDAATILKAGFEHIGSWELREGLLHCVDPLPARKGVYAFVQGERVMYVGLASRSLAQRLAFYRKPGLTQSTNIRLNSLLIATLIDDQVSIYVALPEDGTWNGLPMSTAEGLEAGLIANYDLPWNTRGSATSRSLPGVSASSGRSSLSTRVLELIARRPNLTEAEIANALFGGKGYQQKVNPVCRQLVANNKVERHGSGGPADPFTYRAARQPVQ